MSIIDDWGPQPEEKNPMKLEKLSPSELSNLAFLFGGVGDGKHICLSSSSEFITSIFYQRDMSSAPSSD